MPIKRSSRRNPTEKQQVEIPETTPVHTTPPPSLAVVSSAVPIPTTPIAPITPELPASPTPSYSTPSSSVRGSPEPLTTTLARNRANKSRGKRLHEDEKLAVIEACIECEEDYIELGDK